MKGKIIPQRQREKKEKKAGQPAFGGKRGESNTPTAKGKKRGKKGKRSRIIV